MRRDPTVPPLLQLKVGVVINEQEDIHLTNARALSKVWMEVHGINQEEVQHVDALRCVPVADHLLRGSE